MAPVNLADAGDGNVFSLPEAFQSPGVFGHFFQQGKQLFDHFFTSFFGTRQRGKRSFFSFREFEKYKFQRIAKAGIYEIFYDKSVGAAIGRPKRSGFAHNK